MHSFIAAATLVGSALASGVYYETTAYHTATYAGKPTVYSSVSTCTEKPYGHSTAAAKPYGYTTSAAVYAAPTKPVYYSKGAEVTYTSYTHVTATYYGKPTVYSSAVYSVSTCTEEGVYGKPTAAPYSSPAPYYASPAPYYSPPSNTTSCTEEEYAAPTTYVAPTSYVVPTYTNTYYTTVCPGGSYCYGTTVTSTYCPETTSAVYVSPAPVYTPAPAPVYTTVAPYSSPCPTANATATYAPPPSYTGAASSNVVSFGMAAVAGLAALIIAA